MMENLGVFKGFLRCPTGGVGTIVDVILLCRFRYGGGTLKHHPSNVGDDKVSEQYSY